MNSATVTRIRRDSADALLYVHRSASDDHVLYNVGVGVRVWVQKVWKLNVESNMVLGRFY